MIPGDDRWRSDDPLADVQLPTFDGHDGTTTEERLAAVMAGARQIHEARERERAQQLAAIAKVQRKAERRQRARRIVAATALVLVVLAGGLALVRSPEVRVSIEELAAGIGADEPTTTASPPTRRATIPPTSRVTPPTTDEDLVAPSPPRGDRPTPTEAPSSTPLGAPPPVVEDGPYEFTVTGPDDEPGRYDPCRPITVVVNDRLAPPNGDELVDSALAEVSRATGLQFVREGGSDEAAAFDRAPYQPDRYGDRWAPVLIAWTDEATNPELVGDTVGQGGSAWLDIDGHSVFVSGAVVLDSPELAEIASYPNGTSYVRAVLLHELAHVVGLAHVEDPAQLMYAQSGEVVDFAAGDLAGLAVLGQGPCIRRL